MDTVLSHWCLQVLYYTIASFYYLTMTAIVIIGNHHGNREAATAHQFSITNKSAAPPEDLTTLATATVARGTEGEKKALLAEKTGGVTADQKQ